MHYFVKLKVVIWRSMNKWALIVRTCQIYFVKVRYIKQVTYLYMVGATA